MPLRSSSRCGMRVRASPPAGLATSSDSPRAYGALRTFARVFPIARPRARLWRGLILRLSGHPSRACVVWRDGLEWAGRLDMPYEQALLHLEIGRHAEVGGAAGTVHLECAGEILTRLGAASDLARLAAIKEARPDAGSDQIWSGKRDGSGNGTGPLLAIWTSKKLA